MAIPHPDYPTIDFKPAIARYDWDQTYDVLEFVHLPEGFYGLMQQLGIPCFELMAIDRFTPYRYLWAEQYSDYVYNFLKQFNFSPHNSILERLLRDESGELIKDSNNNNIIIVPAFSFTGDKYSPTAEYKVTLSEGSYGVTGLVYQGWKDGVIGSIPTINQASYKFTLSQPTDVDLNKIINHWCQDDYPLEAWKFVNNELVETVPSDPQISLLSHNYDSQFCVNSLVLSKQVGGAWVQQSVSGSANFLLYSDIADYFTEVSQALKQYFDDVHQTYGVVNKKLGRDTFPLQSYLKERKSDSNLNAISRDGNGNEITGNYNYDLTQYQYMVFTDISLIVNNYQYFYDKLPIFLLNDCFLHRANNNKWNTGNLLLDIKSKNYVLKFIEYDPQVTYSIINNISYNHKFRVINNIYYSDDIRSNQGVYGHYSIPFYLFDFPNHSEIKQAIISDLITSFNNPSDRWTNNFGESGVFYEGNLYDVIKTYVKGDSFANNIVGINSVLYCPNIELYSFSNVLPFYCKKATIKYNQEFNLFMSFTGMDNISLEGFRGNFLTIELDYTFNNILGNYSYIYTPYQKVERLYFYNSVWKYLNTFNTVNEIRENFTKYELFTQQEWEELYNYGSVSDADYLNYLLYTKAQLEENMVDSVRLKEIHACLGAEEFAYYDNNGDLTPYKMHIARNIDYLMKTFGLYYNPDGTLMSITTDVSIPPTNNQ